MHTIFAREIHVRNFKRTSFHIMKLFHYICNRNIINSLNIIGMNSLKDFTNLYPLSKTLRFRLEPQGKTLEHIQNYQIIENDERRSKEYKKMKEFMDDYHRAFIDKILDTMVLRYDDEGKNDSLQEFLQLYSDSSFKTETNF